MARSAFHPLQTFSGSAAWPVVGGRRRQGAERPLLTHSGRSQRPLSCRHRNLKSSASVLSQGLTLQCPPWGVAQDLVQTDPGHASQGRDANSSVRGRQPARPQRANGRPTGGSMHSGAPVPRHLATHRPVGERSRLLMIRWRRLRQGLPNRRAPVLFSLVAIARCHEVASSDDEQVD
jgi:hypothetical protein